MRKRSCPRTDPCGALVETDLIDEVDPLSMTYCFQLLRHEQNQFLATPLIAQ